MTVPRPLAFALWPLSVLYGWAAQGRAWLYKNRWLKQKCLNRPVISIGNITVGGTGKTPMVIWLAERLLAEGKRVAVLSRGYRGSGGTSDEIELMKDRLEGRIVFGVGNDRYSEGRRLEAGSVDVFILDDGFQHLQLARDVDIVLIDASREFRNEMLLPAGLLREPRSSLARADAIIYTRMSHSPESSGMIGRIRGLQTYPLFTSETRLLGFRSIGVTERSRVRAEIGVGPFFAFCGVGNPEAFFMDLNRWGFVVAGSRAFPDHHKYTAAEVAELENAALQSGATAIVTTEKDSYNFVGTGFTRVPVHICIISLGVIDENEFFRMVDTKIGQHQGAGA